MTGSDLVLMVRNNLQDVETATVQGRFWIDNSWVLLGINSALQSLVSYYVRTDRIVSLQGLIRKQVYASSPLPLPTDYMHSLSARVLRGQYFTARLNIGAPAVNYLVIAHYRACIIGNTIWFGDEAGFSGGELTYYKQPQTVADTSTQLTEFEDMFYYTVSDYATALLSIKDTASKRMIKRYARTVQSVTMEPPLVIITPETRFEK